MKKYILTISLGFLIVLAHANTGDTTIIVAQPNANMVSPPSNYDAWTVFPDSNVSYQKVLMRFTLGCGTPNCSHWDYTVMTSLGKKSGTLDSTITAIDTLTHDTTWSYSDHVDFIEIGRLITPYATYMDVNQNGFNHSWTHPYYYDVTDYVQFLKDSTEVRVHYDGWSDGFSAKVEFIFIEGPPTRDVEEVRQIYNTSIGYANSAGFESVAVPKTFPISANTTSAKVVIDMTGHGNQGEFDPHYFHIKVNGAEIYEHILWKDDCDYNPIQPQGGTWPFHRANWCPGEKVPIYEVDITPYITPGQDVTLDLDLDDFTIGSGNSASYTLSAHLITYTNQKNNDVMMEEIIAPNSDKPYLHWNPITTHPKVIIKNTGKRDLTYAEISYWVKGGVKWYYEWRGDLPPFESELITLPSFDWNGLDTTDRVFIAEANWPNNVQDEYTYNNHLESNFNMAPKLDSAFFIFFKSNNQPWEDSYIVKDDTDAIIDTKDSFAASTIYRDTLRLAPGSYAWDFYDIDTVTWGCGDGLQFFVNQPPNAAQTDPWYETTGQLSLRKMSGTPFKTFLADFGANVHYEFTVGYPLGYNVPKTPPAAPVHTTSIEQLTESLTAVLNVFPNPANDVLQIQANMNRETSGEIIVSDIMGKTIAQYKFENSDYQRLSVPVKGLARGMYFVSLVGNELKLSRKVILQ